MAKNSKCTWYQRAKAQAQGLRCVVRAYPSTVVWPVLVFAVLCGVGVWGVTRAAQSSAENAKAKADFLARDAALEYRQLLSPAFSMTKVLAAMVDDDPQYTNVSHLFNATAPALLRAAQANAVQTLQLMPSGVIRLVHPLRGNDAIIGFDLFQVADPGFKATLRAALENPHLALEGPLVPRTADNVTVPESILVVRQPIFVAASHAEETFGRPEEPNPSCGRLCGYNETSGLKFWGIAAVVIQMEQLLTSMGDVRVSPPLRALLALNYRYELSAPGTGGPATAAASSLFLPSNAAGGRFVVERSPVGPLGAAVQVPVDLPGVQWTLRVGPDGGSWMPGWYGGVVAAVVVMSLAAAMLLFGLLVSRRKSQMLLQSLLPTELIRDLQAEQAEADPGPRHLNSDCPADLLLDLLGSLLEGQPPDLRDVVLLRTVLRRHLDVYRPLNLGGRIREANLDNDVASALIRQLGDAGDLPTGGAAITAGGAWDVPAYSKTGRLRGPGSNAPSSNTLELLLSTAQHHRELQLAAECQTMQGALAYILYDKEPDLGGGCSSPGGCSARRQMDVEDDLMDESGFASAATVTGTGPVPSASGEGVGVGVGVGVLSTSQGSFICRASAGNIVLSSAPASAAAPAAAAAGLPQQGGCQQQQQQPGLLSAVQSHVSSSSRFRLGSGSGFFSRAPASSTSAGEGSTRRGTSPLALNRCAVVVPAPPPPPSAPPPQDSSPSVSASAVVVAAAAAGDGSCCSCESVVGAAGTGGGGAAAGANGPRMQAVIQVACSGGAPATATAAASACSPFLDTVTSCTEVPSTAAPAAVAPSLPSLPPSLLLAAADKTQKGSSGGGSFSLPSLRSLASRRRSAGPVRVDADSPRMLLQGNLTAAAAAAAAARAGGGGGSNHGQGAGVAAGEGGGCELGSCANGVGPASGETESAVISVHISDAVVPPRVPMRTAAPPRPLLDEVERLLSLSEGWQFDTWGLQEASGGHALSCLGFYLLQRAGLLERFRLEPLRVARLLRQIEAGYHATNPYHNAVHAADVTRTLHVLLRGARMTAHYVDHLGLLACYFAALVHDFGHPGLTNDFLIASGHPLALRYNDRSPLESHHAASAFTLLSDRPDLDILAGLSRAERAAFRKQVIEMVLATDMKQHFAILKHFTTVHRLNNNGNSNKDNANNKDPGAPPHAAPGQTAHPQQQPHPQNDGGAAGGGLGGGERTSKPTRANGGSSSGAPGGVPDDRPPAVAPAPVPMDEAERLLSLQMALKVADIGHLGAELERHKRWLGALEEEFFRQGDQERDLGLPISPLFDRSKQGVSKSQVGFFDFVALPLVRAVAEAFPGADPLLHCFTANYQYWREVEGAAAPPAPATPPTPPPPPPPAVQQTAAQSSSSSSCAPQLPGQLSSQVQSPQATSQSQSQSPAQSQQQPLPEQREAAVKPLETEAAESAAEGDSHV